MLNQQTFDLLLNWLDHDRERAGEKYEEIRRRLIKFFECRRVVEADELADETINRVTKKLPEIIGGYSGNPVPYFYGVASNIHLESLKRKSNVTLPPTLLAPVRDERVEAEAECLDDCLGQLTSPNRELMLEYYQGAKQEKIAHRKSLAQRLDIAPNALRIRAYRLRSQIQECLFACLSRKLG
ncbi:MAG: hypothetical protein LC754_00125 [Acidobacteria bacterium]|nr:hypothetical protein [Acidobacteriota bacterium]